MTIVNSLAGTTSHPDLVCNQKASNKEVSKSAATSALNRAHFLCVRESASENGVSEKSKGCEIRLRAIKAVIPPYLIRKYH